jgi:hypothetical protein
LRYRVFKILTPRAEIQFKLSRASGAAGGGGLSLRGILVSPRVRGHLIGSPYRQQKYYLRSESVIVLRSFPKEQAPTSPPQGPPAPRSGPLFTANRGLLVGQPLVIHEYSSSVAIGIFCPCSPFRGMKRGRPSGGPSAQERGIPAAREDRRGGPTTDSCNAACGMISYNGQGCPRVDHCSGV